MLPLLIFYIHISGGGGGGGSLVTNGLQISCLNFENHSTLHLRCKCFCKTHPRSILSMEMFTCCCCYTGAPWPPFLCTRCSLLPMWKLHCIRCSRRWCQTLGVQERNSGNASISSVLKQVFTNIQQENALLEKKIKKNLTCSFVVNLPSFEGWKRARSFTANQQADLQSNREKPHHCQRRP